MLRLSGDTDLDLVLSGDPVLGIGEPLPSVVVARVASNPEETGRNNIELMNISTNLGTWCSRTIEVIIITITIIHVHVI